MHQSGIPADLTGYLTGTESSLFGITDDSQIPGAAGTFNAIWNPDGSAFFRNATAFYILY